MEDQIQKNMEMKEVLSPASMTHKSTINSSVEHLLYIAGHSKHQLNFVCSRLQNPPLLIALLREKFNQIFRLLDYRESRERKLRFEEFLCRQSQTAMNVISA